MNATPGVSGAPGPPALCTSTLPTPHPGGGSAGLRTRRREATAVCKQASSACLPACLRDVHAGPWEGRHARPRPGQTRRAPGWRPARSSRTRPRRNPGPGKGFSAARGLVAPRAPPASRGGGGGGDPRKKRAEAPELRGARGGRSARTLRPPRPESWRRGAPERREPASPAPRRATLTASPWPGGFVPQPQASSSAGLRRRRRRREASHSGGGCGRCGGG